LVINSGRIGGLTHKNFHLGTGKEENVGKKLIQPSGSDLYPKQTKREDKGKGLSLKKLERVGDRGEEFGDILVQLLESNGVLRRRRKDM